MPPRDCMGTSYLASHVPISDLLLSSWSFKKWNNFASCALPSCPPRRAREGPGTVATPQPLTTSLPAGRSFGVGGWPIYPVIL